MESKPELKNQQLQYGVHRMVTIKKQSIFDKIQILEAVAVINKR